MKHNDFITIGVIIAPHGVRGDLRIMPQTDFPERFMHMDACYIDGKEYHVASARFHKQFVLASFKEIPDRNTAESGPQDANHHYHSCQRNCMARWISK